MNARDLLVFFAEQWKGKHDGKPYPIAWGKEGSQLKRLLGTYDADYCRDLILHFFRDTGSNGVGDTFVARAGFTVGVFISQVPRLVREIESGKKIVQAVQATRSDADRIAAARHAISVQNGLNDKIEVK